ncbi:hypothetical protein [Haliea salexigens]|nr:hypothetical protein [Haliea salexigens]
MNDVKYMFPDRRMAYPKPMEAFWKVFPVAVVSFAWGGISVYFWLGGAL